MGTNMYPSSSLLGHDKDASIAALPVDELIEKADGFAGVFPGQSIAIPYFLPKYPGIMHYSIQLQSMLILNGGFLYFLDDS